MIDTRSMEIYIEFDRKINQKFDIESLHVKGWQAKPIIVSKFIIYEWNVNYLYNFYGYLSVLKWMEFTRVKAHRLLFSVQRKKEKNICNLNFK